MNKARRKELTAISDQIEELKTSLESVMNNEDTSRDQTPENLQDGEHFQKSEQATDSIEYAMDNLTEAIDNITESIQ